MIVICAILRMGLGCGGLSDETPAWLHADADTVDYLDLIVGIVVRSSNQRRRRAGIVFVLLLLLCDVCYSSSNTCLVKSFTNCVPKKRYPCLLGENIGN